RRYGWSDDRLIISALEGGSQKLEALLNALPLIIAKVPQILFVVAGQLWHDAMCQDQLWCIAYSTKISGLIQTLQLSSHVVSLDKALTREEIDGLNAASDFTLALYPPHYQTVSDISTIVQALSGG